MGTQAQGDFFIYNLTIYNLFIEAFNLGVAVVEEENLIVGLALLAHHGGTDLTETHTVTPALAIEDELASIIEPFGVGANAAIRLHPEPGKKAIVFGAGAIGLTAAITLKYKGDAESLDEIKDKALSLGATVIVDNAEGIISIDEILSS